MTLDGPNEVFAFAVRRYRERVGISQSQLARRMSDEGFSWHQMTVARTESGERPVRLDEAMALSNIFRVGLQALYQPASLVQGEELTELQGRATNAEENLRGVRVLYADEVGKRDRLREEAERARERYEDAAQDYEAAVRALNEAETRAARAAALLESAEQTVLETRRMLTKATARHQMDALESGSDADGPPPEVD